MFAPREKTLDMVLVGKVANMWYGAGDGDTGTNARALAVAQNLPPMIIAPYPRTERIAYVVYENATKSSEAVGGLDDLLANNRAFGATEPEALTKSLMLGLAHWAAMHWPDLKL
jgi:hypothetical protein